MGTVDDFAASARDTGSSGLEVEIQGQTGLCLACREAKVDAFLYDLEVVLATASFCVHDAPDVETNAGSSRRDRADLSARG